MTAPMLTQASELVIMRLVHIALWSKPLPDTPISPGPPMLGRDSHLTRRSSPVVSAQQRTSGSSSSIHNNAKKPNPSSPATTNPATVAGAAITSRRSATARLLTAANQITNVAGRKKKPSDESVETLATNDSSPTPISSPPRTPGFRTLEAMSASRYGVRNSRARAR